MPRADINRRTFLKGATGTTAAVVVSAAYSRDLLAQETDYMRAGFSFFSPTEVPVVEALAEQIWPGDDDTVGGRDAGVAVYIDRALSGAYTDMQPVYRLGLDWVDQAANDEFGANFADLSTDQQVAFLETHLGMPEGAGTAAATPSASPAAEPASVEVEGMQLPGAEASPVAVSGDNDTEVEGMPLPGQGGTMLAGGEPPAVATVDDFLQIFRTHTIEGLFADPVYGGNRDKRVWADLQYGGPYYVHTEEQQLKMDGPLDIPIQSIIDF
jgi:gluconate 2-dehydrogenase gamma chain